MSRVYSRPVSIVRNSVDNIPHNNIKCAPCQYKWYIRYNIIIWSLCTLYCYKYVRHFNLSAIYMIYSIVIKHDCKLTLLYYTVI